MNDRKREKLKHATIRPEIEQLLDPLGLHNWIPDIARIGTGLVNDFDRAMNNLIELDSRIPGLGQHNVNERTPDGHLTGVYQIGDRPIFRGIQYVGMHLDTQNPEYFTRMIVSESCYHVEASLKRRTGIQGPLSVGMILKRLGPNSSLSPLLYQSLSHLNSAVYNNAKHTIEHIDLDGHMFSVADAIAVYLSCRVIGAKLLEDSGIATKYGSLVFGNKVAQ